MPELLRHRYAVFGNRLLPTGFDDLRQVDVGRLGRDREILAGAYERHVGDLVDLPRIDSALRHHRLGEDVMRLNSVRLAGMAEGEP